MIAPDSSLSPDSSPPKLVKLRHPKTDKSAVFLLSGDSHLHEVLTFSEDHRSWFLGERVASDGRLYLVTRMDPLFLVLPYLARAERLVPLSQMLDDDLYPSTDVLSNVAGLDKVADTKGDKDLNVWKYNEEKTLEWLVTKVRKVAGVLAEMRVDVTAGAAASNFQHLDNTEASEVEYNRYSLGIVSDYLDQSLAEKLREKLMLPAPPAPTATAGNKRVGEGVADNKPAKKPRTEGPEEDYSKGYKKATGKEGDLNNKQKALANSAKGTKNIMSFFKKK